jgi:hypothetical protein
MYLGVFKGAELESAVHLSRNLIGWPIANWNPAAKKTGKNTYTFGKTMR